MIRTILLLLLMGIGIIVGASIVQAEEIVEEPSMEVPEVRIESISNSWGPVSSDVTTIVTQILLNEPNLSSLPLSVFCSVYLNDIKMAEGPGENLTVERTASGSLVCFTTRINNNTGNITKWWVSHIRNGEKTKVIIEGKLIINLGKVDSVHPFSWKNEFQTNMLEGVSTTDVGNFRFGLYTLQIKSLDSEWGKITNNETEIRHRVEIHNPSIIPGAPIVNRVEYDLSLNGIKMEEGDTGLPLVIWPGGTKSVVFITKLDKREIKTWWVSHIKSDEKTSYRFRYSLLVKLLGATLARWPKEIKGAFETDFLARKTSQ